MRILKRVLGALLVIVVLAVVVVYGGSEWVIRKRLSGMILQSLQT